MHPWWELGEANSVNYGCNAQLSVPVAGETRRKNRGWDLQWSLRVKLTRTQGLPCFFYLLKDPLNVEHYCPTFKLFCLILMNLETTPPRTDQHRYDREQLGSQGWILLKLHEIIKHEKTWYLASKLLQFLLLNFLKYSNANSVSQRQLQNIEIRH